MVNHEVTVRLIIAKVQFSCMRLVHVQTANDTDTAFFKKRADFLPFK